MTLFEVAILAQAISTFGMFGVIWLVQLATYPLQVHVPPEGFVDYQAGHMYRISFVVGPLMLVEAGTAAWLLFLPRRRPGLTPRLENPARTRRARVRGVQGT